MNSNFPKKKNQKRRTATVSSRSGALISTFGGTNVLLRKAAIVRVPPHLQLFPDEFDCWGRTDVSGNMVSASSRSWTFKANGPFNLFGPQVDYAGAFGANVPAGAQYLISTNGAAGASAPYQISTVLGVEVEVEWITTNGAVVPASYGMVLPSLSSTLTTMAQAVVREQRGCSSVTLPAATTETPSPIPLKQVLRFTTADLFGVSENEILQNPSYSQTVGSPPEQIGYVHIVCTAADGSTSINYYVRATFRTHYRFRRLNSFQSAIPATSINEGVVTSSKGWF